MKKLFDKKWKIAVAVILVLAIIIGIGVSVAMMYFSSKIEEGDVGTLKNDETVMKTPDAYKGDVLNILVCGIDYDADDEGRDYSDGLGMTDVILYVNYDLKNNKVNVLQIPRDSFVGDEVSTGGTGKINAAFSHGENQENRISNLAKVINDQYQLPVDRYVTINMDAFKTIINVFGGIQMNIPWDITDGEGGLMVPAGPRLVTGDEAEILLRQRKMYATADYGRLEFQQYFYAALLNTLLDCPLTDLVKMAPSLLTYINTDFDVTELMSLAVNFKNLDKNNIYVTRSPGGGANYINENGQQHSVFNVNADNMADLLNNHFREYSEPVSSDKFTCPKDLEYPWGETYDEGKYMGSIS